MSSRKKWSCSKCSYTTNRKYNLELHYSRKSACLNRLKADSHDPVGQNVYVEGQNVYAKGQKVNVEGQKVNAEGQNVNAEVHTCDKCGKYLSCEKSLKRHHINCKGIPTLQCPTCLRFFETKQGKNQHIRNVICSPPEDVENKDEKKRKRKRKRMNF